MHQGYFVDQRKFDTKIYEITGDEYVLKHTIEKLDESFQNRFLKENPSQITIYDHYYIEIAYSYILIYDLLEGEIYDRVAFEYSYIGYHEYYPVSENGNIYFYKIGVEDQVFYKYNISTKNVEGLFETPYYSKIHFSGNRVYNLENQNTLNIYSILDGNLITSYQLTVDIDKFLDVEYVNEKTTHSNMILTDDGVYSLIENDTIISLDFIEFNYNHEKIHSSFIYNDLLCLTLTNDFNNTRNVIYSLTTKNQLWETNKYKLKIRKILELDDPILLLYHNSEPSFPLQKLYSLSLDSFVFQQITTDFQYINFIGDITFGNKYFTTGIILNENSSIHDVQFVEIDFDSNNTKTLLPTVEERESYYLINLQHDHDNNQLLFQARTKSGGNYFWKYDFGSDQSIKNNEASSSAISGVHPILNKKSSSTELAINDGINLITLFEEDSEHIKQGILKYPILSRYNKFYTTETHNDSIYLNEFSHYNAVQSTFISRDKVKLNFIPTQTSFFIDTKKYIDIASKTLKEFSHPSPVLFQLNNTKNGMIYKDFSFPSISYLIGNTQNNNLTLIPELDGDYATSSLKDDKFLAYLEPNSSNSNTTIYLIGIDGEIISDFILENNEAYLNPIVNMDHNSTNTIQAIIRAGSGNNIYHVMVENDEFTLLENTELDTKDNSLYNIFINNHYITQRHNNTEKKTICMSKDGEIVASITNDYFDRIVSVIPFENQFIFVYQDINKNYLKMVKYDLETKSIIEEKVWENELFPTYFEYMFYLDKENHFVSFNDDENGLEPYIFNAELMEFTLLNDLREGSLSSAPKFIGQIDSFYYFTANTDNDTRQVFVWNASEYVVTNTESVINEDFHIFPNPAINTINLPSKASSFSIFNSQGQKVLFNKSLNSTAIDVSMLQSGLYFIEYKTKNNKSNKSTFTVMK